MPENRLCTLSLLAAVHGLAQQTPTPAAGPWWHETSALADDSMQGRDTGSEAYERAAKYVAAKFAAAGLKPAGDNGTFFQRVPMHQIDLDIAHSSVEIVHNPAAAGAAWSLPLQLLQQVTLSPREDLPPLIEAPMIFIGYGLPTPDLDLHGKVAVFFNSTPKSLSPADRETFPARRLRALSQSGAAAVLSIDNPNAIEPFHWPAAYARTVTIATGATARATAGPIMLRISSEAAANLLAASGHEIGDIRRDGAAGDLLPIFPLKDSLRIHLSTTAKDISSPNILAILPGSAASEKEPADAAEFVALSAHLDGYGFGTPVLGDRLYNGALDDAAYVATLLELARKEAALPPAGRPRRSLLFCIFTGEEKGLLGSAYFTEHPTVPITHIVADLNLDQLRPIFPLKTLTVEGLTDSTLGDTARTVARKYSIELRPDLEPERNLFRRADNYNFVRVGVPIASFIFGYNRGTPEEATYRDWYALRYHKPQDDLTTPIDWGAAVTFNDFFRDLTRTVADAATRPAWSPTSPYAPTKTAAHPHP